MLEKRRTIENVRQFIIDKYFIFKDKQKNVFCNNNFVYGKVNDDLILCEDNLLFNIDNNIQIINLTNYQPHMIYGFSILNVYPKFLREGIIIDELNTLYCFDKLNFNPKETLIKNYNWGEILMNERGIILCFNKNIQLYSIYLSKIIWQFDISIIPNNPHNDNYERNSDWKIKKFIGVLENKLWIALNHHTIIALDIETGQLVHQIHDIPDFHCEWLPAAIPLSEATVIDEKENKLVGFMWEFYWEINPQNGIIILQDLTDKMLPLKIRNDVFDFVLTDENIYFASHNDSQIGCLDRQAKQITWHYAFEKDEHGNPPRIMNIQGNENMIGALSSKGNLYLFEKEDRL